jgi:aminoglycoside phosphotransferase family enzyme/predicted kinase
MEEADLVQDEVLAFLGRPQAYDPPPTTVERIDTHASSVFLAGAFAYKVKRAVKYPFLDFSSLEKRRAACLNELRVNARTAPELYLDVIPVTRDEGGALGLGGEGQAVEWVLRMRRFDQAKLYDRMASEGRLGLEAMKPLAEIIADFHDCADRVLTPGQSVRPLERVLADNEVAFAADPDVIPLEAAGELAQASRAALTALTPLLRERARGGYVRHCHGDLHLRNIVEIDGAPVLFDAIEFDDGLATIDVLYDLAFLLMDLGKRGLGVHANTVLNAYLDRDGSTGNLVGLAALPLFLSMRATIRAKVELLRAGRTAGIEAIAARDDARAYFDLAGKFLAPTPPRLIAIGGVSGSGKSALSRAIAPQISAIPGALHVRSDVERKRLFGVDLAEKLPPGAYAPEISDLVYRLCRKRANLALTAGRSVIVDAVHARPDERRAIAEVAEKLGVSFTGLWLEAPREVMQERVAKRTGDVSDATIDVVDQQLSYDLGAQSFAMIDAGRPFEEVVESCLQVLRKP